MAKDTFWVFVAQFIGVLGSMGLIALLTKNLTKYDFGQFQLLISSVALSNIVALNGLNKSNLKGAAKGFDEIIDRTITLSLKFTLPLLIVCLIYTAYKTVYQEFDFFTLTVLAFGCFGVVYSSSLYLSFLNGKRKFFQARLFSVIIVISRLLILGLGSFYYPNIIVLILLDFGIQLIIGIVGTMYSRSLIDKNSIESVENNKEIVSLIKLGWGFTGLAGFNILASKLEKIILGAIDPISLASYQVGAMIPNAIKSNVKSFISVPIAYWIKLEAKDNSTVIMKYWHYLIALGIASFLFVMVFLKIILSLFFTAEYASSFEVGYILSISLIFIFLSHVVANFFIYQGYERVLYKTTVGFSVLKIISYILIIPLYGIYGLILSIVLIEFLNFIVTLIIFLNIRNRLKLVEN